MSANVRKENLEKLDNNVININSVWTRSGFYLHGPRHSFISILVLRFESIPFLFYYF